MLNLQKVSKSQFSFVTNTYSLKVHFCLKTNKQTKKQQLAKVAMQCQCLFYFRMKKQTDISKCHKKKYKAVQRKYPVQRLNYKVALVVEVTEVEYRLLKLQRCTLKGKQKQIFPPARMRIFSFKWQRENRSFTFFGL